MTSTHALTDQRNTLKTAFKWLFLLSTSAYVCYKLASYSNYSNLFHNLNLLNSQRIIYLTLVLVLLPLNLFFETYKWRYLVSKTMHISFVQALKAVLAGFSTGFTTPNRIGEMAGRMLFVKPEHRKITAFYVLLNGFTQNLIIAAIGLPALIYFWSEHQIDSSFELQKYILFSTPLVVLALLLYLAIPKIASRKLFSSKINFLSDFQHFKTIDLLRIIAITLFRYLVFSVQMYGMLHFFNVNISLAQALVSIPASYLGITLIPTFAFSEASVRSSVTLFFIGTFCNDTLSIALATLALWLLNFGLPMLVGLKVIADIK